MNEIKQTSVPMTHEITIKGRKRMSITGVREVISFDENTVNLRTVSGDLAIEGEGLHIGVLDTERGVVTLEGASVDGAWYLRAEDAKRKGIFGRVRA